MKLLKIGIFNENDFFALVLFTRFKKCTSIESVELALKTYFDIDDPNISNETFCYAQNN